MEPGDLLLVHPDSPYELRVEEELQTSGKKEIVSGDYFIFADGKWLDAWWNAKERPSSLHIPRQMGIPDLFRQINLEKQRQLSDSASMLEWYMKILCVSVDRALEASLIKNDRAYLAYRMKEFVEGHYDQAFQLDDVARHAGISVSGAVRLYKQTFGTSIMQDALDMRLNMARERILFTPMPLAHVAESSGFANYTYFHRVFRAKYGMSPSDYRRETKEPPILI